MGVVGDVEGGVGEGQEFVLTRDGRVGPDISTKPEVDLKQDALSSIDVDEIKGSLLGSGGGRQAEPFHHRPDHIFGSSGLDIFISLTPDSPEDLALSFRDFVEALHEKVEELFPGLQFSSDRRDVSCRVGGVLIPEDL